MAENLDPIVVVGTGPSSAAFCARMQELGQRVTVISEGQMGLPTYTDRISKIDASSEIWKFSDTQASIEIEVSKQQNFDHIAIHGTGGLSNRWGGGVAKLDHLDLGINANTAADINSYYDYVQSLIGVVGNVGDPLAPFIGTFKNANAKQQPRSESLSRLKYSTDEVVVGRSAQAIRHSPKSNISQAACNSCGHCSIFCGRGSFYNAGISFERMRQFHQIVENTKVSDIKKTADGFEVIAVKAEKKITINAGIVVLAAGPVNSFKILKKSILAKPVKPVQILNTPILRGMAFSPFGQKNKRQVVGSTIARVQISQTENALVTFVGGESIPVSDWLSFFPFRNKFTAWCIRHIRKYFMAYMVFFNSDYSENLLEVPDDHIKIKGRYCDRFSSSSAIAIRNLKKFLGKNRFIDIAMLRATLPPGRDIHCGGTLPMSGKSSYATTVNCELISQSNLYVIDGSWMPRICEKSHTFTLMANAARVADIISTKPALQR